MTPFEPLYHSILLMYHYVLFPSKSAFSAICSFPSLAPLFHRKTLFCSMICSIFPASPVRYHTMYVFALLSSPSPPNTTYVGNTTRLVQLRTFFIHSAYTLSSDPRFFADLLEICPTLGRPGPGTEKAVMVKAIDKQGHTNEQRRVCACARMTRLADHTIPFNPTPLRILYFPSHFCIFIPRSENHGRYNNRTGQNIGCSLEHGQKTDQNTSDFV